MQNLGNVKPTKAPKGEGAAPRKNHVAKAHDPFGVHVNSYNRMAIVLANRGKMSREDWFRQLGAAWSSCDNICNHRHELRLIICQASQEDLVAMMEACERDALAALPERIEVFRGCYDHNRDGLSWTTSQNIAANFVRGARYHHSELVPVILRGWVNRGDVVLKLDRCEQEIIAADVFDVTPVCP